MTTPIRSLTLILALVSVLAVGCSPDCRSLCEEQEEASCYAGNDAPDCERECMHTEDLVANAVCEPEWDAYLECLDALENICDAVPDDCSLAEDCDDPKCDDEADDLSDCIGDYCQKHPRNNECSELIGGEL